MSILILAACSGSGDDSSSNRRIYNLDANAAGVIETVNNIANLTVVSRDDDDLKAEYRAGFVQGKFQATAILSARDNSWDNAYLTDPNHTFPGQIGPTQAELARAAQALNSNYAAFIGYLTNPATNADVSYKFKRLLFRMLGIYHGATLSAPASLDFSGNWLPDSAYLQQSELVLGYETTALTFMDVYYINSYNDLMDVLSYSA